MVLALRIWYYTQKGKPITQKWLFQLILALILICHCSYRGVVELLQDLFDYPISAGTVHNRVKKAI